MWYATRWHRRRLADPADCDRLPRRRGRAASREPAVAAPPRGRTAPQSHAGRARLPRTAHRHDGARRLRADRPAGCRGPLRLRVPAGLAGARRRGLRSAAGAHHHQALLRGRFGFRTWRLFHWLAYAAWPIALVHALGTGSDGRVGWMQVLALALTAAVVAAVIVRLANPSTWPGARIAAGSALLLAPLALLLWY